MTPLPPDTPPALPLEKTFSRRGLIAGGLSLMGAAVGLAWLPASTPRQGLAPGTVPQLGAHFVELENPFPAPAYHVRFWFWWGCPHCHRFEQLLLAWADSMGARVVLERVPFPGGGVRDVHAAVHLTASLMGVQDALHPRFFDLAQAGRLNKTAVNELLVDVAVDPEQFWELYRRQAPILLRALKEDAVRSGVTEVPTLVVGGRYRILGRALPSFEAMLDVAQHLVTLPVTHPDSA